LIVTLKRDPSLSDRTLGGLFVSTLALHTLELPWVPCEGALCGHPDQSCVPIGTYSLELHDSPTHPQTWALVNHALGVYHSPVEIPTGTIGRSEVLLHAGNYPADSLGCILVGRSRMVLDGEWIITGSRLAIDDLHAVMPWGVTGNSLVIS
jgi:hypothetical protein